MSAGGRKRNDTASGGRPAASSAFSVTKWPIEPRVVPMRLPFRSAAPFSVASGCTSTAVPYGSERFAPITLMRAPDASAKITGASPIGPQSTAAAFSASASGAAAGNSVHAMSYATVQFAGRFEQRAQPAFLVAGTQQRPRARLSAQGGRGCGDRGEGARLCEEMASS